MPQERAQNVKKILPCDDRLLWELKFIFMTTLHCLITSLASQNKLRTGIQRTPYQKSYELVAGSQSRTVTFNNAYKQFSFLEISLVFDRSDQHLSIYDSYNAEVAATQIKSIKLQNASNTYSEFNTVKFDLEDEED